MVCFPDTLDSALLIGDIGFDKDLLANTMSLTSIISNTSFRNNPDPDPEPKTNHTPPSRSNSPPLKRFRQVSLIDCGGEQTPLLDGESDMAVPEDLPNLGLSSNRKFGPKSKALGDQPQSQPSQIHKTAAPSQISFPNVNKGAAHSASDLYGSE
jgi:hypothetical protein